uniref:Isoprenylcysteine carboxyl methyltransferase (ICMT) family n=1 Tax=Siphoviridae sp. ctK0l2 TaxID=2826243 RepID=A0A8S5NK59_9CAUD|nr:MAG TPA: Isoprenylcysteine carboxyl methyltransferase (ICMT) family [Siphoviridae sp. ctK0l2]
MVLADNTCYPRGSLSPSSYSLPFCKFRLSHHPMYLGAVRSCVFCLS